jgi:hypothetical protein
LFVAPLWTLYEGLAYRLNHGWHGQLRTGIDFLIKAAFDQMHLPLVFGVLLPAGCLVAYLVRKWPALKASRPTARHFALMFLESLLYAAFLGFFIGKLTGFVLLSAAVQWNKSAIATVVMRLGAGVYEEFVFRFVLMSFMIFVMRRVLTLPAGLTFVVAVILNGFLFSVFHYLDYFGQPLMVDSFLFRFFGGMVFAAMFLIRGIGVTVYTHSIYNVLLFLRS